MSVILDYSVIVTAMIWYSSDFQTDKYVTLSLYLRIETSLWYRSNFQTDK